MAGTAGVGIDGVAGEAPAITAEAEAAPAVGIIGETTSRSWG